MGRILNEAVDEAAIDGGTTLAPRLFVSVLAALVLQASLTPNVMLPWLVVLATSEVLTWLGTQHISAISSNVSRQRVLFIVHIALSTSLWSLVCVWLWFSSQPGLRAVGAIIICAQLIHAQAYAYRSRVVSSISSGIPAGVITVLTLGYAGLSGLDQITAIAGLGLTFGYVEAGTRANIANAHKIAAAQFELERLAYTDALTALANRRRFSERLEELIEYSREHRTPFALILVDLDGFKAVNDEFGHDMGDEILVAVAESLRQAVCEPDRVARLGGDEFALLVSDVASGSYMANLFRKIEESLSANKTLAGHGRQTTLSVGAAMYPGDGQVAGDLFKAADLALYAAKGAGRNTWRAYRHAAARL